MPPLQAIFGGTFDPPHAGHIAAARCARDQLDADAVHVVVANDPWQKSRDRQITPAHHRLAMTKLAFEGVSGIEVSDIEIRRGGPSYAIDTVSQLEQIDSVAATDSDWIASDPVTSEFRTSESTTAAKTVLVVGPEAARGISSWHRADELRERVRLGVVQPHGEPEIEPTLAAQGWSTIVLAMRPVPVTATLIRDSTLRDSTLSGGMAKAGIAAMVPPAVRAYIRRHNLYRRVSYR